MKLPRRRIVWGLSAALALPTSPAARAQPRFPTRVITLLVPFAPGGIADITARTVGEQMARTLGQPVIIDNRPGAGSIVASQAVASARPDGHTLLLMSNGHAVSVGLFHKLAYDPVRDFAPISTLAFFDLGLFVAAASRFADLRALLAQARARPGTLNIGTIAPGSTQHLSAKLFETVAGITALIVPYKSSPALLTALRAGEVDLAFEIAGPLVPQVQAGVVRALAVSSSQRNPALPEVPTVGEAGLAGYDVASWNALAAPADTPPEVLTLLGHTVREAIEAPAVRARLAALGVRLQASNAAVLRALLASEIKRWGAVIRDAHIQPE
jgi:tripartite-type tricarboxylate transporter receptor subunit TctC